MKNKFFKKGFSLIEMLVVISIFSLLAIFVISTFNNSRNEIALKDAQTNLIFALEQARNQATAGVGQGAHGVYIDSANKEVFVFEGDSYSQATDIPTPVNFNFEPFINEEAEIIFNRLSGTATNTATDTEIILEGKDGSKKIIIEQSGRIKGE